MAEGKHRGCKWRHRNQITGVLAEGREFWLFAVRCTRCGRRNSVLG